MRQASCAWALLPSPCQRTAGCAAPLSQGGSRTVAVQRFGGGCGRVVLHGQAKRQQACRVVYLWNLEPDGLLEPWMLVWQVRQARPISRSSGAGPVASPAVVSTSLGCPVMVWHCWHSIGTGSVSNACWLEPCGSWQVRQSLRTGACSNRNGPRFSAWQV